MNYQRNGLGVAIATVLALTGCGTAVEQDKGAGTSTAFHARIVDGYLAGSLVFVDSNDNGVLDAWEERAFTDRDGFVSASATGKDYCAAGAQPTDAVHCLKVRPADALKIRASGGYDMSTGEPFNGAMSLDTTWAAGSDSTKPVVTSPLTTLLAGLDAADKQTVIAKLGLSADGVSAGVFGADFIKIKDSEKTSPDQRKALTAAMQLHKTVEVISSFLTSAYAGSDTTYSGLGKNAALPRDASEFIYAAFAELVASKILDLDVNHVASSPDKINLVIDSAQKKIEARVSAVTKKAPADLRTTASEALMLKLRGVEGGSQGRAGQLASLGSQSRDLFDIGTELSKPEVEARLRAINIVATVARDTAVIDDRVADALAATGDLGAPATNLSLKEGDKNDISMKFTTTAVETVDGVTKATGGTLALDINAFSGSNVFNKDASSTSDPSTPPKPTSVPGTWEKLNDYSLLVTIEPIPGVKQQAVVKPTIAADGTTKYFFDYGGKQIEWGGPAPAPN